MRPKRSPSRFHVSNVIFARCTLSLERKNGGALGFYRLLRAPARFHSILSGDGCYFFSHLNLEHTVEVSALFTLLTLPLTLHSL